MLEAFLIEYYVPKKERRVDKMVNVNDIYGGGDFLKTDDVTADLTLTIKSEELRALNDKDKIVLSFEEINKTLVLNKINAQRIAEHHGEDTKLWIGKKITLYRTTTEMSGKDVPCIRIKKKEE